jgi:hypothetical protein
MRSRFAGRNRIAAVLVAVGLVAALVTLPSPARADDEATEQARQHNEKGKKFFGQWDDAIAEYREAYKLRSDPAFSSIWPRPSTPRLIAVLTAHLLGIMMQTCGRR